MPSVCMIISLLRTVGEVKLELILGLPTRACDVSMVNIPPHENEQREENT